MIPSSPHRIEFGIDLQNKEKLFKLNCNTLVGVIFLHEFYLFSPFVMCTHQWNFIIFHQKFSTYYFYQKEECGTICNEFFFSMYDPTHKYFFFFVSILFSYIIMYITCFICVFCCYRCCCCFLFHSLNCVSKMDGFMPFGNCVLAFRFPFVFVRLHIHTMTHNCEADF